MTALLITLNILAGLFLIGVVLLQSGKGADMGAAFGGATSTVFGPSGSGSALTKATAATAAVFMGSSLMLAVLSAKDTSVFDGMAEPAPLSAPAGLGVDDGAGEDAAAGDSPLASSDAVTEQAGAGDQAADSIEDAVKQAAQQAVQDAGNPAE